MTPNLNLAFVKSIKLSLYKDCLKLCHNYAENNIIALFTSLLKS